MRRSVLVLGSGPIRIGQGIEFDYSCVHCVWALNKLGYRAILINNNPETVSTDFDTGDGLYFEPVTLEDVMDVIRREEPEGVVCQFGGQTAINLAEGLHEKGVKVLGTSPQTIAMAEDRYQFDALLESLDIPRPRGMAVRSYEDAVKTAQEVGYPVLVRPSFVLGGRAMDIVYSEDQLREIYAEAEDANPGQPVLVDQYILGAEAEVDVICDGEGALIPGIMEHVERAGVHSGDSMAVYPPVNLSAKVQRDMATYACRIARALQIRGLMNIQFVIRDETVYILEVNPRASRTVPFLSKVTGIPMVDLGTRCMMGESLASQGFSSGLWELGSASHEGASAKGRVISESELESGDWSPGTAPLYAVKAPVFSFQKLSRVEPSLGPEMKSTGEVMGIDFQYDAALYKALVGSGITFKKGDYVVVSVNDLDKPQALEIARELLASGHKIASTGGTYDYLTQNGIEATRVNKIQEGSPSLLDLVVQGQVSLMINTPTAAGTSTSEAKRIRRACIESGIACVTSIDTAVALATALKHFENPEQTSCEPYTAYLPR